MLINSLSWTQKTKPMHLQGNGYCEVFWGLYVLLAFATAFWNDGSWTLKMVMLCQCRSHRLHIGRFLFFPCRTNLMGRESVRAWPRHHSCGEEWGENQLPQGSKSAWSDISGLRHLVSQKQWKIVVVNRSFRWKMFSIIGLAPSNHTDVVRNKMLNCLSVVMVCVGTSSSFQCCQSCWFKLVVSSFCTTVGHIIRSPAAIRHLSALSTIHQFMLR